ncbi:MAG: ATP-grasp domain-containing protein [Myxococcales bacterium]|nr:ATP-grasp domain-containing protein [Myxococcales bacterium]MCB9713806.1 ATP-grasp domain-containing protein [Myxococcales bacterium]
MRPLTFGVLTSAASDSHPTAVDQRSAQDLATALGRQGHHALILRVDEDLDLTLRHSGVDACVLALHGRRGSRGDIQALLELRGLPFAGPSGTAAALAFDKVRSRQLMAYHNLPVPAAVALGPGRRADERALELLGWPCVVKPRRGAHGEGISRLESVQGVRTAIEHALDVDHEVILERAAEGRELQVVLLDDRVLGVAEVRRPLGTEVLEMCCPAPLPRGRRDGVENLARQAVRALGLGVGLTRVDMILHPRNNELILEVEPLPPLHRDGVVSRVARAAGLDYDALVGRLVDPLLLHAPRWAASSGASASMLQ